MTACLAFSCRSFWPADPVDSPESNFEILWNEFHVSYALFEQKNVDWNQLYHQYRPMITSETTDQELFDVITQMLTYLDDTHVYLSSPFDYYTSGKGYEHEKTFSLETVKQHYLTSVRIGDEGVLTYGFLSQNVGYIHIDSMTSGESGLEGAQSWARTIPAILEDFADTKGLVVDVRNNGGGLPQNAEYIASLFCDEKKVYSTSVTKNGPGPEDFSERKECWITPAEQVYSRPVALLTNGYTASAAEDFTMAMVTMPNVTQMGTPTVGIFSLALNRELPNGWEYAVSVQKVFDSTGHSPEGIGISPKPENLVENTVAEKNSGIDRQLDAAFERLSALE